MRARTVVGAALLLAVATGARATEPARRLDELRVDVWQTRDGLPQNTIQAILQDRRGYLWVSTEEGLARFDGVRFTVYDRVTLPALPGANILPLVEGADGTLWMGIYGGGLAEFREGRVGRVFSTRDGLLNDTVTALAVAADGTLWVGTTRGLNLLKGGRVTADPGLRVHVRTLLAGRGGDVWVGTTQGLSRVGDARTWGPGEGLASPVVNALAEDGQGGLWIGTAGGLQRLRDGRLSAEGGPALAGAFVRSLQVDRHGGVWVGTTKGLSRLAGGAVQTLTRKEGLSGDVITALLEDREGSLWAGTTAGGLDRLREGSFVTYGTHHGLVRESVSVVLGARAGGLWIAGSEGQLVRAQGGGFRELGGERGLGGREVRALHEEVDGALLVGTNAGPVYRYRDGRYTVDPRYRDVRDARVIAADAEGTLWLGTDSNGLYHLEGGRLVHQRAGDGIPDNRVRVLRTDRRGRLWIGTYGGLTVREAGRFRTYTKADGLPSNLVRSLHEDAEGVLWIGTYGGGLARLKDGRLSPFTTLQGLPNDMAYEILEDGAGHLWVSGNRGIYRVARRHLHAVAEGAAAAVHATVFGEPDGMASAECNGGRPAGWRAADGRLWFPTVKGVAVVDPARLHPNPLPPTVVIEEMRADGHEVPVPRPGQLGPGHQRFEFRYTGLGLLAPDRVRFRHRLDGFDDEWVEAGPRRAAFYTNLAPGAYRFRVRARSHDGPWTEGEGLDFVLAPRLHQTAAFRVGAGLGLLVAGGFLYRLRTRHLRARAAELSALVDERTRDVLEAVRQKDEVVSMVAHDLRSPLTVISGYAEVLEARVADPELRGYAAVILRQSAHVASLASDMLTTARIESGRLPLDRRELILEEVVREAIADRVPESGVHVSLEGPAGGPCRVEADAHWIRQVVENLVGNAVKYSPDGADVRVKVARAAGGCQVSVSDQGLGIAAEDLPRLFRKFSRLEAGRKNGIPGTGLGLFICRSIVEAHGGRIWADSEPGRGSTFHFVLPG